MSRYITLILFSIITAPWLAAQSGQTDPGFLIGPGASHSVNVIKVLPGGKIVVGGDFTSFNSTAVQRVIRLHPDGTHDLTYQTYATQGGIDGPIRSGALQPNGKMLLGGLFNTVNGLNRKNIVRLDTNGSVDATFITGSGANNEVTFISTNGNRILLSGFFNSYNGQTLPSFVCLLPDGSIDTSFSMPAQSFVSVSASHILPNNKVYLAGNFTTYNGTPINRMVRLNADGSIDTSFNIGIGFNSVIHTIAVQADGKILAGGGFATVNGIARSRIARLNTDGSVDTSFNPGTGASSGVRSIALLQGGRILIGGDFPNYNGMAVNRIALLHPDGSLDTSFQTQGGTNGTVMSTTVQVDGKMLIGGVFTNVGGSSAWRIARLMGDSLLTTGMNHADEQNAIRFYPNPGEGILQMESVKPLNNASLRILNMSGSVVLARVGIQGNSLTLNTSSLPVGIYIAEIREGQSVIRSKIVRR